MLSLSKHGVGFFSNLLGREWGSVFTDIGPPLALGASKRVPVAYRRSLCK